MRSVMSLPTETASRPSSVMLTLGTPLVSCFKSIAVNRSLRKFRNLFTSAREVRVEPDRTLTVARLTRAWRYARNDALPDSDCFVGVSTRRSGAPVLSVELPGTRLPWDSGSDPRFLISTFDDPGIRVAGEQPLANCGIQSTDFDHRRDRGSWRFGWRRASSADALMVSSHSADELHSMLDPLLIETTQPLSALSSLSRELILDSVPLILARVRLALLDP